MYQAFLKDALLVNPHVRVIGLTATPYRMGTGLICAPGNILNHVCFDVGVKELIVNGFLCPVRSKAGKKKADLSELHIRGGEWIDSELQSAMMDPQVLAASCSEILESTADRKSVLIFCCGIDHAKAVSERLPNSDCVFGHTLNRGEILEDFKAGKLKYLCNMNVLTTGFDAPNIDCVAMLRPTLSPGLYYQMVGRGFRLCPGKTDCLIMDFGQNIVRHGPVDQIRAEPAKRPGAGGAGPAKECPKCNAVIAAGYSQCPECKHDFEKAEREAKHTKEASEQSVISEEVTVTDCEVQSVKYRVHNKKDAPPDAPRTLRVDYACGMKARVSEWICLEHAGFVREKAAQWWKARSYAPVPKTIEEAVELAEAGALAAPTAIKVRHVTGEKFERIIGYEMGPIPEFEISIPAPPEKGDLEDEPTEYCPLVDFPDDVPF
jgi:DNA repair protein RadD